MRAHHLLAQRWKLVFMLFHGFTLGALRQPEESLISIITGQRQTSGLNQLALHRTQGPSIFSPTTAEHFEGQRTPPARQRPNNSSTEHPSAGRRTGTPSTAAGLTKPQRGSARPLPGPAPVSPRARGAPLPRPARQIGVSCPAPRGRAEPAGTKQQVAPAEAIRITFNARAGSIFSPVYAEGPGAALLMLQGTRGTH